MSVSKISSGLTLWWLPLVPFAFAASSSENWGDLTRYSMKL